LTGKSSTQTQTPHDLTSADAAAGKHLTKEQHQMLLEANPALARHLAELANKDPSQKRMAELMKNLSINEMLTGLSAGGKNAKDTGSHKFWKTQPVPSYEEVAQNSKIVDGPIKDIDIEKVSKEPTSLGIAEGMYHWVTMDLDDEKQLQEVCELLENHYVEDHEAMFRFKYSSSFLRW
jgi:glycylpeptide N-tetradecanoyltransferase